MNIMPTRWSIIGRGVVIVGVLGVSILASYGVTRTARHRTNSSPPKAARDSLVKSPFPNGRYLVAFVFVAAQCGFCADPATKRAIARVRLSLRRLQPGEFAQVSVVGVAIDEDLAAGIEYLGKLGPRGEVFDEISVGRSWMNEFVTGFVWRAGIAEPEVPQLLLVERQVDAAAYPRHIVIRPDSVLLRITGRNDLMAWVEQGTPLDFPSNRSVSPATQEP